MLRGSNPAWTHFDYTFRSGDLGCGLVGPDRYRETVNPDHTQARAQYHVLPKGDAELIVGIMRAAAGLPPLHGERDDEGG